MIGRGVERVEAMPFGLDIRPFGESETHSPKNSDPAVEHLGERMERAELGGVPGSEMSILASAPASFAVRRRSALCWIAAVTALRASLRSLPTIGRSSLRERFHPIGPGRNAAVATEITDARGVERLLVGRGGAFGQRGVTQLFQLVSSYGVQR